MEVPIGPHVTFSIIVQRVIYFLMYKKSRVVRKDLHLLMTRSNRHSCEEFERKSTTDRKREEGEATNRF